MIQSKEESLKINKTARLYSSGDLSIATKLLIVLHGYGQLPRYFIQKFESLPSDYYVIAPEGFHRFYLKGSNGRVGASWMTKEAREDDITDNNDYLQSVLDHASSLKTFDKTMLLGFSQGGATAARFYFATTQKIDSLLLWASVFPPDVSLNEIDLHNSNLTNNHFILGTSDEYFDEQAQEKIVEFFKSNNFHTHVYNGNHDIDSNTLIQVLSEIE